MTTNPTTPAGDDEMRERVEQLIDKISDRLRTSAEENKQAQYRQILALAEQYKDLGVYASTAIFDMWERIDQQPERMANQTRERLQKALLPPEPQDDETDVIVITIDPSQVRPQEEDEDYEW